MIIDEIIDIKKHGNFESILPVVIDISSLYSKHKKEILVGIYKITSPSGKVYIGESANILERLMHYKVVKCEKQHKLYNSFIKYGVNNHIIEIIKICNKTELGLYEIFFIERHDSCNSGLNIREGGKNGKLSIDTKRKISKSLIGNIPWNKGKVGIYSQETKEMISKSLTGIKQSQESRDKKSKKLKGRKRSQQEISNIVEAKRRNGTLNFIMTQQQKEKLRQINLGKPSKKKGRKLTPSELDKYRKSRENYVVSEETRRKISESHIGKPLSESHKNKISQSMIGVVKSEETKINMSKAQKGRKLSEATRKRISEVQTGKKHSEETKNKRRKSMMGKNKGKKYGPMSEEQKKKLSEKIKKYWQNIRQERLTMIF